jgi:NDP-sugar pyrophosphorylase family protein
MVEIGGRPILWHITRGYSVHGIIEFVIRLHYKAQVVKESCQLLPQRSRRHDDRRPPQRIAHLLESEAFCFAYGTA